MKITTKGRYGARVMLELAMRDNQKPTPLRKLARDQEISAKYLEQILIPLMSAGLVKSVRGARGGYMLGKPANEIHLYDIVRSLEGPLAPVECVMDAEYCDRVGAAWSTWSGARWKACWWTSSAASPWINWPSANGPTTRSARPLLVDHLKRRPDQPPASRRRKSSWWLCTMAARL